MKIETQTVAELYQVLKQMVDEGKGDYSIGLFDPGLNNGEEIRVRQCKIDDEEKWLELLIGGFGYGTGY